MYAISIEPPARADIARIHGELTRRLDDPEYPDEWFDEIHARIATLSDFPLRCGLAPEDEYFEEEIRHLLVGSWQVLFTVRSEAVHVLHVRHGRQRVLRPDE